MIRSVHNVNTSYKIEWVVDHGLGNRSSASNPVNKIYTLYLGMKNMSDRMQHLLFFKL